MPYTDAWVNSSPAGSTAASSIDDEFRKMRLQIDERMKALVVDWKTDPVVPLTSLVGPRTLLIPHTAFVSSSVTGVGPDYEDARVATHFDTGRLRAAVSNVIPASSTITLIEWLVDIGTCPSIRCELDFVDFSLVNSFSQGPNLTTAIAGIQLLTTAPLSVVIDPNKYYSLEVIPITSGFCWVHAVRITYTLP